MEISNQALPRSLSWSVFVQYSSRQDDIAHQIFTCSKSTNYLICTPWRQQKTFGFLVFLEGIKWQSTGVFIVNFKHILHNFLVFLLLTLDIYLFVRILSGPSKVWSLEYFSEAVFLGTDQWNIYWISLSWDCWYWELWTSLGFWTSIITLRFKYLTVTEAQLVQS